MTHWAAQYIGRDYVSVGRCWGLVQMVCREQFATEMPTVCIGSRESQAANIKRASRMSGWRHVVTDRPISNDIVVMQGPDGPHVGFALLADGQIGLLHARYKGVSFDPWNDLSSLGLKQFEFWRRAQ